MSSSTHRIFITGSSGFAGRYACHYFRTIKNYYVIGGDIAPLNPNKRYDLDDLSPPHEFIRLDITNRENVREAIKGCTTICHFAALVPYNLSQAYGRSECLRINVGGTEILVQEAIKAGVKNFILCSSTGVVFGGDAIAGGTESLPTNGPYNDPYSESKAKSEEVVLTNNNINKMATVAIRPNGIMGPGEAHHTPKLMQTARTGFAPFLATGSTSCTDFTSRKNLIHAFDIVLNKLLNPKTRSSVAGQAYFVTDDWPVHTLEFFSPILEELGFIPPFPSVVVPKGTHGYTKNQRITRSELNQIKQELQQAQNKLADINVSTEKLDINRKRASSQGTSNRKSTILDTTDYNNMIILTGPAYIPIPGIFLYPIAYISEWISFLCRPIINFEPFLTAADVRKVTRNNYYCSNRALNELQYTPVESPAAMLHDMATFLREQGYNGYVKSPGIVPWLAAPPGVALTGLLGYNYYNILTNSIQYIQSLDILPSTYSSYYYTTINYLGSLFYSSTGTESNTILSDQLQPSYNDVQIIGETIKLIFWAATFCHFLQGCFVGYLSWKRFMDSGRWFIQGFLLGYPSTQAFWSVTNLPHPELVQLLGLVLFMLCIPFIYYIGLMFDMFKLA